jgi:hypothetical protein
MTSKRKLFGALAFSAALAGGGVAGAVLGTPLTSGAQDSSGTTVTTTAASTTGKPAVRRAVRDLRHLRGVGLDAAAKALNMTPAALRAELKTGKSIADVANEKGVPVQTVIDAIVGAEKTVLENEIDKLPAQVTKIVNHKGAAAATTPTTATG